MQIYIFIFFFFSIFLHFLTNFYLEFYLSGLNSDAPKFATTLHLAVVAWIQFCLPICIVNILICSDWNTFLIKSNILWRILCLQSFQKMLAMHYCKKWWNNSNMIQTEDIFCLHCYFKIPWKKIKCNVIRVTYILFSNMEISQLKKKKRKKEREKKNSHLFSKII